MGVSFSTRGKWSKSSRTMSFLPREFTKAAGFYPPPFYEDPNNAFRELRLFYWLVGRCWFESHQ